jgi:molybdate transport system ATP-binding protein
LVLHVDSSRTCREVVASGFHDTVGLFEAPSRRHLRAANQWLAKLGMTAFADTPFGALSTGWQRMALLARAVVKQPRLLILDEPCQGLDAPHRRLFVATVDRLIRSGTVTAIFVTHRADEIPPAIQKVLRLGSRARRQGSERVRR